MDGPALDAVTGVDGAFDAGAFADVGLQHRLDAWRQGDLVADIGLCWAGTTEDDPITGVSADPSGGHRWPVIAWDGAPADGSTVPETGPIQPWSVITSQTCDVVATGPGARHPLVQVSPLINLAGANPNAVTAIQKGERVDRVWVDKVPGGGAWAADLRVSLPVSKAILAAQERRSAFASEQAALDFSERVAAKLRRPALHGELTDGMRPRLREFIAADSKSPWLDDIEQFRLLVVQGTRLEPTEVALVVVTLDKLDAATRAPLRKWQQQERKRLSARPGDPFERAERPAGHVEDAAYPAGRAGRAGLGGRVNPGPQPASRIRSPSVAASHRSATDPSVSRCRSIRARCADHPSTRWSDHPPAGVDPNGGHPRLCGHADGQSP